MCEGRDWAPSAKNEHVSAYQGRTAVPTLVELLLGELLLELGVGNPAAHYAPASVPCLPSARCPGGASAAPRSSRVLLPSGLLQCSRQQVLEHAVLDHIRIVVLPEHIGHPVVVVQVALTGGRGQQGVSEEGCS